MKLVKRVVVMFVANGISLYLASKYIPGVTIPLGLKELALVTLVLTSINLFIRPFIKLVFTPVIILTLGLGSILVNAAILYFLDLLLPAVTIEGLIALLIVTLIVSTINVVLNFLVKAS